MTSLGGFFCIHLKKECKNSLTEQHLIEHNSKKVEDVLWMLIA